MSKGVHTFNTFSLFTSFGEYTFNKFFFAHTFSLLIQFLCSYIFFAHTFCLLINFLCSYIFFTHTFSLLIHFICSYIFFTHLVSKGVYTFNCTHIRTHVYTCIYIYMWWVMWIYSYCPLIKTIDTHKTPLEQVCVFVCSGWAGVYTYMDIFNYVNKCKYICMCKWCVMRIHSYGVATISRLLQIIGLFWRI